MKRAPPAFRRRGSRDIELSTAYGVNLGSNQKKPYQKAARWVFADTETFCIRSNLVMLLLSHSFPTPLPIVRRVKVELKWTYHSFRCADGASTAFQSRTRTFERRHPRTRLLWNDF